ncbi:hypothetical protein K6119_12710 [Paracrocinitomix mangrovi]|uniref:hypothetical protein n=1 Tax=Paracrocinitomix mangrovi TaxID=2862509 RepID=UPI001C8E6B5E|nr:hypothetical protein [Paracrocinitomix mangrovi]UKN00591.1 hypothetical protein K6119_12710 [Paracrocinitomix mangrovi]
MKKDIEIPKVEDISVAVVKEWNDEKTEEVFNVYLINLQNKQIQNTLVTSKGYGENQSTGEKINTSVLRHFIGDLDAKDFAKIEPIIEEVFGLNNEYWVSFFQNNQMYDKKFIFLPETICDENMINVPLLNKKGVVI